MVISSMGVEGTLSTSNQSRDPELQQPCWLHPWEQALPEAPGGCITLREALEVPVLPGPGSASPDSTPNPYDLSGGGSMLAPGLGLAGALSWATTGRRPVTGRVSSGKT
jgi:hypothetical protein